MLFTFSKSQYTPDKYSTPTRKSLSSKNGANIAEDVGNIRHSNVGNYNRLQADISNPTGKLIIMY